MRRPYSKIGFSRMICPALLGVILELVSPQSANAQGNVRVWGINIYGQLGNGTNVGSNTPVPVSNLTGVVAVAGGANHSLAVKSDGTVSSWGYNVDGELGNGTNTNSNTPAPVSTHSERLKRQQALIDTIAHLRIENLHLDEELKNIFQRHVDGEISFEEFRAAIDELNERRFGRRT